MNVYAVQTNVDTIRKTMITTEQYEIGLHSEF